MKIARMYCQQCGSEQKCLGKTPNHLLHFLLSLVTFGLWLLVWMLTQMSAANVWTCDACGSDIKRGAKRTPQAPLTPKTKAQPRSVPGVIGMTLLFVVITALMVTWMQMAEPSDDNSSALHKIIYGSSAGKD